jgi:hypothetical protein
VAWSVPKTWTVGEFVTAAMMNVYVRDNMNFLHDQFGQWTPVPFNNANFFTDAPSLWLVAVNNIQQNQSQIYNGNTLLWSFSCGATRLTSPSTYLYLTAPNSGGTPFHTVEQVDRTAYADSFPAPAVECLIGPISPFVLRVWRVDGLQFTAGTALGLYFNVFMRIS